MMTRSSFLQGAEVLLLPGCGKAAMLHMVMNEEKWNALPRQYQAILNQAGTAQARG